jgi:hypothetical protein
MGFFSRRKDKESALSQADLSAANAGAPPPEVVSPVEGTEPPEAVNPTVAAPAPSLGIGTPMGAGTTIADEVSRATGGDVQEQMAGLMSLMNEHAVDLRSQPMEVREAVAADCRAQGVDMQVGKALNVTDPKQIQIVVDVLKQHKLLPVGVQVSQ